jgi:DNA-binding transcriptional MerR regulator
LRVRLSELSLETGLPVPTIKYYLREGLLAPGDASNSGPAEYGESHVRRARLIRALAQVGDLPLSTIASILDAIDDDSVPLHEALGVAHYALAQRGARNAGSPELAQARIEVDAFLADLGWAINADAPDRDELASALETLRCLGWRVGPQVFTRYAQAADKVAKWELSQNPGGSDRERAAENAVVGTVVFEAVLTALRRLAQEHHSAARFTT